jgi:membrane glycosyltransferase
MSLFALPSRPAPLDMPRHGLYESGRPVKYPRSIFYIIKTLFARFFVLLLSAGLAYYGITEIHGVLAANGITPLQWVFLIFFSLNFVWIAYAFSQACLGFLASFIPTLEAPAEADVNFKTAILLPVYNEDPKRLRAALKAMRDELITQAPHQFAFFLLSDSNHPQTWVNEQAVLGECFTDDDVCPVYYRRRHNNQERKAGNIAEWVQNWGGAYEAMIVLDADSLMSADCLIKLTRRLAAQPKLGLIQTLPTLIRAKTLYGRLQQFANHCFGPIYARGLSAWHGLSSNFWGHNAIIRTKAFAEACCLPILPGKAPFGGHVLSHDFIEAAMMRRAGWGVRFDTDLSASYEEAPPSLADVLIRDRRWCQGNLQHAPFMVAQGFVLPTRLHIFAGIMSYLSAVFWLMLIMVGFAIAIQAQVVRPEYFSNLSLFPTWPVFDAERALNLFYVSMALVLAPKVFGWLVALLHPRRCMEYGGPILLTLSTLAEVVLSALYAPILMVSQFGVVYSILRGKDSGWKPQSRDDGALSWYAVGRMHALHTLFGFALAATAFALSLDLFYWLLPISLPLIFSIPMSWISGGERRSHWFNKSGLLRAPLEKRGQQPITQAFEKNLEETEVDAVLPHVLEQLLNTPLLYERHLAQLPLEDASRTEFHAPAVTAEWKINHAVNFHHLQAMLQHDELMAILLRPSLLLNLAQRFG